MANKRVSELNELLAAQVDQTDLFLVTDVSAFESKRIRAVQLQTYALAGTASYASNANSASYALNSSTASFLRYNGVFNGSASYAISASFALSSSWAAFVQSASYAISASYALSSSYASMSFWAVTASYAQTASVNLVISSALADLATSASYLIYTPGFNNGTASYAISSSRAVNANTASFLYYGGAYNGSASAAIRAANADSASNSQTASFLYYNGSTPNGTASMAVSSSYAQRAKYVHKSMLAGVYDATLTSVSESRLLTMSLNRSDFTFSQTAITFTGTAVYVYTGSMSGSLTMAVYNRGTLITTVYDYLPISFSLNPDVSGTVYMPFTLQGQNNLVNGDYLVYVTASVPTSLFFATASLRPMKFKIESESDSVVVS